MPSSPQTSSAPSSASVSRRDFLAQTAGATTGAAVAAMVVPHVHASSDETLKVALIGCGGRGTGAAAQALSTQGPVVLWAMADLFADKIELSLESLRKGEEKRYDREPKQGLAARIDVPPERRFAGFDAFRRAIDSGVDVAILTSFPHFRPEHYEYAVERGVHVFQEKPLGVDAPGIRRVLAADKIAREKQLKVVVGLQRHHSRIYLEAIQRIRDGALGKPHLLRCYWNSPSSSALRPRGNETEMEFQLRNKYFFTWLIGDHIVEQHIHNIDVCNWVMEGYPVTAQGMGGRQYRNGREHGEIFDHHFVEFTYADGTKMFSQCRQMPGCWTDVSEAIHGPRGVAELSQSRGGIQADGMAWRAERDKVSPYQVEHDVLFDAIRNGKSHNETESGALSTLTAIMGRMATYSGKVVTWDDAMKSELSLAPERYALDAAPPVLPDEDGVYPCAMPGATKAW